MTQTKNILLLYILLNFVAGCNNENSHSQEITGQARNDDNGVLVKTQEKKEMILLTERPANLETQLKYFLYDYTPNDVFFVRWHLANMPSSVDTTTFRLSVSGHVNRNISLSLHDLKTKFKPFSIVALAECAGNSRSFFDPRVAGGQWKNGAMGNAKWTGVKLSEILKMAGIKNNAFEISFNGMDEPPIDSVPDFIKSLKAKHCMEEDVIVAYEMNDRQLPLLNGYPLKLVVPGWYATYWVGMLKEIKVYSDTFKNFWMQKAYLVPENISNGNEKHDSLAKKLVPISKLDVRSIFVSPEPGTVVKLGEDVELEGLAFDYGAGIKKVEISQDGKNWMVANLNNEIGKYSWRRWKYKIKLEKKGNYTFYVKATNSIGETQPTHQWNRSGYMRNEIEKLEIKVE